MKLKYLKDTELEASFHQAVAFERKALHVVIEHIQEYSRRKLYLARGYSSLFSYLTSEMKYSNAAAQRRIEAARLATAVPSVSAKIESGEINLSHLSEVQSAVKSAESIHQVKVTAEVKTEMIERVLNLSVAETQQLCATMLDIPVVKKQTVRTQKDNSKRVDVTFSQEQYAKFERVRDLLAHKHLQKRRAQNVADVLETMFDELLSLKDPNQLTKGTRSNSKRECSSEAEVKPENAPTPLQEVTTEDPLTSAPEVKWHSLTEKRKKVILREQRCCQFKDHTTGRVCGSTFNLHVDHIQPKWDGGANDPHNLQVLCREHNLFRYRH